MMTLKGPIVGGTALTTARHYVPLSHSTRLQYTLFPATMHANMQPTTRIMMPSELKIMKWECENQKNVMVAKSILIIILI